MATLVISLQSVSPTAIGRIPPFAFLRGKSETEARLSTKDVLRHPDNANPTNVARVCSTSAQTVEAGPVASWRMCCALYPEGPGADALGKSQRQARIWSGETSTMD